MVSLFNHALAGIRYGATYDVLFSRLDQLVFHANVANIAHWSMSHFPLGFFRFLEIIYYGMFGQITATLIFIVLRGNQQYGVKYVRTLLVCYAIAITVFTVCPVKGPYSIGTLHLMTYPRALPTFWAEEGFLQRVRALYAHQLAPDMIAVSFKDYFVGFPQPAHGSAHRRALVPAPVEETGSALGVLLHYPAYSLNHLIGVALPDGHCRRDCDRVSVHLVSRSLLQGGRSG